MGGKTAADASDTAATAATDDNDDDGAVVMLPLLLSGVPSGIPPVVELLLVLC
jgi:hypothetical protein